MLKQHCPRRTERRHSLWDRGHQPIYLLQLHPGIQSAGRLSSRPSALGRERTYPALPRQYPATTHWAELFHRWFLNMVAHWRGTLDKKYASVSLLVGAQGTRKSTFTGSIVLPEQVSLYGQHRLRASATPNFTQPVLVLINIDELTKWAAPSKDSRNISSRSWWSTCASHTPMLCSRCADTLCSSPPVTRRTLLTDPSGSRRFICIGGRKQ